jgi:dTMP kinase
MAAARAQHVAEMIEPALAAGRDVVTDRFTGSSLAYQGHGRGLPVSDVARISAFATHGTDPDVVVLLDVTADVAASRLDASPDRMESAGDEFHERVRAGYRELASVDERWVVVDGSGSIADVEAAVWEAVSGKLS